MQDQTTISFITSLILFLPPSYCLETRKMTYLSQFLILSPFPAIKIQKSGGQIGAGLVSSQWFIIIAKLLGEWHYPGFPLHLSATPKKLCSLNLFQGYPWVCTLACFHITESRCYQNRFSQKNTGIAIVSHSISSWVYNRTHQYLLWLS